MIKTSAALEIPKRIIDSAEGKHSSKEMINWLRAKPRTWGEMLNRNQDWGAWMLSNFKEFEINLEGLSSYHRAWVMLHRRDCPTNLAGFSSIQRTRVMLHRKDCPINLVGLKLPDKARVMAERLDCLVDLTGMTDDDKAWVTVRRARNKAMQTTWRNGSH